MNKKRQEAFRYELDPPVQGVFGITEIDGKDTETKPAAMEIMDISPNGLKIKSKLNIPLKKEIGIKMTFKLNEDEVELYGDLVWQKKHIDEYTYGIQLNEDDTTENRIIAELKVHAKKQLQKKDETD